MKKIALLLLAVTFSFADNGDFLEDEYENSTKRADPLSGYNRIMTSVNDFVYVNALSPVARGYKNVVADEVRFSIGNFFDNLAAPMRFVNNLLQGKIKNSGDELFRFVVNTTVGVGGFGDAGKELFGVSKHDEDFGQTLGYWGVGAGYPIVLPLFGPSNMRDSVGLVGDYFTNPVNYLDSSKASMSINAFNKLNTTSFHTGEYERIKKNALDLYPYLQDIYEQKRQADIKK